MRKYEGRQLRPSRSWAGFEQIMRWIGGGIRSPENLVHQSARLVKLFDNLQSKEVAKKEVKILAPCSIFPSEIYGIHCCPVLFRLRGVFCSSYIFRPFGPCEEGKLVEL